LKKLISAAGFRLKGGGWYETDFKKGNQKNLHDGVRKPEAAKPADKSGSRPEAGGQKPASDKKPAPGKKAAS
jgi:predicted nucleic acid-binding Zn ribbon protein